MITAVELTFKPTEAIIMAKNSTQTLSPLNSTPLLILLIVAAISVSSAILTSSLMRFQSSLKNSLKLNL